MTQLIATNQLTLTNVIDGRTPYVHWAYSDNADGTGLTLTDNGQRYMGYYTDYTQADSTDKTKYTWTDRWANLEPAIEDVRAEIDIKADQCLTQTQLIELKEANDLLEQEIQARLSKQALIDWAEEYDKIVGAATAEAKSKAEEALTKSAERLVEITKLGEKAQKWETTTGYIQAGDDGLIIAKDGSDTKFIVTNDVISFVSGGNAVMTLTKGELKVDNGVFALSVRVGRFVEAPLESNPDINVIRYVGEVK